MASNMFMVVLAPLALASMQSPRDKFVVAPPVDVWVKATAAKKCSQCSEKMFDFGAVSKPDPGLENFSHDVFSEVTAASSAGYAGAAEAGRDSARQAASIWSEADVPGSALLHGARDDGSIIAGAPDGAGKGGDTGSTECSGGVEAGCDAAITTFSDTECAGSAMQRETLTGGSAAANDVDLASSKDEGVDSGWAGDGDAVVRGGASGVEAVADSAAAQNHAASAAAAAAEGDFAVAGGRLKEKEACTDAAAFDASGACRRDVDEALAGSSTEADDSASQGHEIGHPRTAKSSSGAFSEVHASSAGDAGSADAGHNFAMDAVGISSETEAVGAAVPPGTSTGDDTAGAKGTASASEEPGVDSGWAGDAVVRGGAAGVEAVADTAAAQNQAASAAAAAAEGGFVVAGGRLKEEACTDTAAADASGEAAGIACRRDVDKGLAGSSTEADDSASQGVPGSSAGDAGGADEGHNSALDVVGISSETEAVGAAVPPGTSTGDDTTGAKGAASASEAPGANSSRAVDIEAVGLSSEADVNDKAAAQDQVSSSATAAAEGSSGSSGESVEERGTHAAATDGVGAAASSAVGARDVKDGPADVCFEPAARAGKGNETQSPTEVDNGQCGIHDGPPKPASDDSSEFPMGPGMNFCNTVIDGNDQGDAKKVKWPLGRWYVIIQGANDLVDGKYMTTGYLSNGRPLLKHMDIQDRWLHFSLSGGVRLWLVSTGYSIRDNTSKAFIHTKESDLDDPTEAKAWYVLSNGTWNVDDSVLALRISSSDGDYEVPSSYTLLRGLPGSNADTVSGDYFSLGVRHNGKPLYHNFYAPHRWLRYMTTGAWCVSDTPALKANGDVCFARTVQKGLNHPADAQTWLYYKDGRWHTHDSIAVVALLDWEEIDGASSYLAVEGATGSNGNAVNGNYIRTCLQHNGRPMYIKERQPHMWLALGRMKDSGMAWMISGKEDLLSNNGKSYAHADDSDLVDPGLIKRWAIWTNTSGWQRQKTVEAYAYHYRSLDDSHKLDVLLGEANPCTIRTKVKRNGLPLPLPCGVLYWCWWTRQHGTNPSHSLGVAMLLVTGMLVALMN